MRRKEQTKPLRILLVDDHAVVRRGLRTMLGSHPGWQVCGEASTGLDAVKLAVALQPDIVIMDIALPGMTGIEATRQIHKALPHVEVLILSLHELPHAARLAGASGFVTKSDAEEELLAAVEALGRHESYFSSTIRSRYASELDKVE